MLALPPIDTSQTQQPNFGGHHTMRSNKASQKIGSPRTAHLPPISSPRRDSPVLSSGCPMPTYAVTPVIGGLSFYTNQQYIEHVTARVETIGTKYQYSNQFLSAKKHEVSNTICAELEKKRQSDNLPYKYQVKDFDDFDAAVGLSTVIQRTLLDYWRQWRLNQKL